MKRICQRCNVISQDFNLWCQEKYCPADNATEIFDNGEWFGPIEIIQPIVITRSAIIYQARREDEEILLKIANVGCEEKLRLEAKAFLQLAKAGQHPLLPVLLPAHPQGSVEFHPYGWTVIEGRTKYYEVFQYADGTILRNLLVKNAQPWFQHPGWIILSIADVVYYLHKAGKLHLCLNPDVILVRFDKQGYPRPILLDLGVALHRLGDMRDGCHVKRRQDHLSAKYAFTLDAECLVQGMNNVPALVLRGHLSFCVQAR